MVEGWFKAIPRNSPCTAQPSLVPGKLSASDCLGSGYCYTCTLLSQSKWKGRAGSLPTSLVPILA